MRFMMREQIRMFLQGLKDKWNQKDTDITNLKIDVATLELEKTGLEDDKKELTKTLAFVRTDYQDVLEELRKEKEKNTPWLNPYGWKKYLRADYGTILWNGLNLDVPPNSNITPQSRDIQREISKRMLKKESLLGTAEAVQDWIYRNIKYVGESDSNLHKGALEYFQPASVTFNSETGDCDDMAILFNTMMHICGYGKEVITAVDRKTRTLWWNGQKIGHAYNYVLLDGDWIVFDANAGPKQREVKYPTMKELSYWFNYWGHYNA